MPATDAARRRRRLHRKIRQIMTLRRLDTTLPVRPSADHIDQDLLVADLTTA